MGIKKLWQGLSPKKFQFINILPNLYLLLHLKRTDALVADLSGNLAISAPSLKNKLLNILYFGAPSRRVRQAIEYTLTAFFYELRSPLNCQKIMKVLEKKSAIVHSIFDNLEVWESRGWPLDLLKKMFSDFIVQSHVRCKIVAEAEKATRRESRKSEVLEAKKALKEGVLPMLSIKGVSGVYIMRSRDYKKIGVFKPYDEEIAGPHNPSGNTYRGPLGRRRVRRGIRVGECLHREVAAYLVDQCLQLHVVPKTCYARFSHDSFGKRQALIFTSNRNQEKLGSFQAFQEGFMTLGKWKKESCSRIPLKDVQNLFILDIIIGHLDRHFSNMLFNGTKLVAIDNGLSFSDVNTGSEDWYWRLFPQCKEPLLKESVRCIESIPIEFLKRKLHKKCFISVDALNLMEERIIFLQELTLSGFNPFQVTDAMLI